jgi:hypothetical protein
VGAAVDTAAAGAATEAAVVVAGGAVAVVAIAVIAAVTVVTGAIAGSWPHLNPLRFYPARHSEFLPGIVSEYLRPEQFSFLIRQRLGAHHTN